MKAFAGTNFLVSTFATCGLSADVFHLILAGHQLMTGEFVLNELAPALTEKLKLPVGQNTKYWYRCVKLDKL